MYLHSTFQLIESNQDIKTYRTQLKEISKINLRRSSKFNVLAVYGALKCMESIKPSENIGIYVATEYGPINDVYKMMETVSEDNYLVMPFDFLNINGNNVGFYVSQALDAQGKNSVLTSRALSFEKTLQLLAFELEHNLIDDALIGAVDESLENIENFSKYTPNVLNAESKDGSCWFYINSQKEGSLCQIKSIQEFEDLNALLNSINLENKAISLNQFAKTDKDLEAQLQNASIIETEDFYGCDGALSFIQLINSESSNAYHIAQDEKGMFIVIELSK